MGEKLTKKDVEKIEQEIEHRTLVIRQEAIEAVKEARAQGDLSENFEYYAAKRYKNQNESRIKYLKNMLKNATVISEESDSDEVGLNDTVEVYFEEDDEVEKYKVGDRVQVSVNDVYSYYLVIRSIEKSDSEDEDIREF